MNVPDFSYMPDGQVYDKTEQRDITKERQLRHELSQKAQRATEDRKQEAPRSPAAKEEVDLIDFADITHAVNVMNKLVYGLTQHISAKTKKDLSTDYTANILKMDLTEIAGMVEYLRGKLGR